MAFFRKIRAGLVNVDISEHIGEPGNLFFNIETGEIRLSDGITPGGLAVYSGMGGSGGASTQDTPPLNPSVGQLWYNTTNLELYVYHNNVWNPVNKVDLVGASLQGGTEGQILVKKSGTDFDYEWEDMIINLPEKIYTKLIDDEVSGITYLGEAEPGSETSSPVWRIQQISFDAGGNVDAVKYAGGGLFTQVWDSRTNLTYE